MHDFVALPEAEQDLAEAFAWHEQRIPGLGYTFLNEVGTVFQRLCKSPTIHAIVRGNVRRTLVNRFEYVVYYRVVESRVVVFAVLHGKRHEREWKKRV